MKIILILFILPFVLLADDLYLKTGSIIKNVTIMDSTSSFILVKTTAGQDLKYHLDGILKVDRKAINPGDESKIVEFNPSILKESERFELELYQKKTETTFPYLYLLPVSALSFLLAADYFTRASDLDDSINATNEEYNYNPPDNIKALVREWESEEKRLNIYGWAFAGIGVINLAISFKPIEVSTSGNDINLSYRF